MGSALRGLRAIVVICASIGAATLASRALWPQGQPGVPSLLLGAVLFCAWQFGWKAGLLSTALAVLAASYYVIPPLHSLSIVSGSGLRILIFSATAATCSALPALSRRMAERATFSQIAAERALAENRKMLDQVLRRAREPLAPALMAASVLEREARLPAYVRQEMREMRLRIEQGIALLDDLNNAARPGREHQPTDSSALAC